MEILLQNGGYKIPEFDTRGDVVMKTLFAPGCTLRAYKPELIDKLTKILSENNIIDGTYDICCKSDWVIEEDVQIIELLPWM